MTDKPSRKELIAQYRQTRPEAGVYRILNARTGKGLLASSTNLASERNKLEFARSTGSPGALDHRLRADVARLGADAFTVEVLDILEIRPEMTDREIRDDLEALEQLWRERLGPEVLY